jgi:hypothetical protein
LRRRRGVLIQHAGMAQSHASRLGLWLSAILALLLLVEALGGLLVPGLYRDPAGWAAQARGVNVVDIVATLPTLVIAMVLAGRGSWRARIVWLGVLGYVLYNAVIFAFAIAFNELFLVYVAVFGVAVFSNVVLFREGRIPRGGSVGAARLVTSIYLLALGALFLLAWLGEILPALATGTTPSSIRDAALPTNPVYVLDLGVLIPVFVIAAVGLLRGHHGAAAIAGALLVLDTLLGLSIVASTVLQHAVDQTVSLSIIPLFGAIAVSSLALAVWDLRSWRPESA